MSTNKRRAYFRFANAVLFGTLALAMTISLFARGSDHTHATVRGEAVDAVRIIAGMDQYPAGLAERGVQGTAIVRMDVLNDGTAANPSLARSSRSPELDAAALKLAPRLVGRIAPDPSGNRPAALQLPIEFARDSITNLARKSCAEFNTDLAYFRATFSELPIGDLPVFALSSGMLRVTEAGAQKRVQEKLIQACAKAPASAFIDAMKGANA